MSQRGRPSITQTRNDPQRMPFDAAEALLWGRKTYDEHKFLFPRMTELEEQHRAYDARISATEVVAEAAEAATARIRRIEQQVAAIESDEQDRPFDRWAEREITSFKGFIEKNKNVRQKQIELESKVLGLEDSVDKAKDAPRDIEILLHRIGRIENDRTNDANRIKRLERDLDDIMSMRQNQILETDLLHNETGPKLHPDQAFQELPLRVNHGPLDITDETEDEDVLLPSRTEQLQCEQIQGPRSPQITFESKTAAIPTLPVKDGHRMSARMRMMQRQSIYNPKHSRENDQPRADPLVPQPKSHPRSRFDEKPATQMIIRSNAEELTTAGESVVCSQDTLLPKQLIVKLNFRKRKIEDVVSIPRLTRSQARKNNEASQVQPNPPAPLATVSTVETQVENKPATKRRKLNRSGASSQAHTKVKGGSRDVTQSAFHTAESVKSSTRKTVMATRRGQPAKPPVQNSAKPLPITQNIASSSRRLDVVQSNTIASTFKSIGSAPHEGIDSGVLRTSGRKKPTSSSGPTLQHRSPVRASEVKSLATLSTTGPPAPRTGPTTSRGLTRPPLAMFVTPDRATLEEMEKNNPFLL